MRRALTVSIVALIFTLLGVASALWIFGEEPLTPQRRSDAVVFAMLFGSLGAVIGIGCVTVFWDD